MSKYDIKFKRLALLLLPTFLRRPGIASLCYAAAAALSYLHAQFVTARDDDNYRLGHNGQVCYLRAALNDSFDPQQRRITITENTGNANNNRVFMRDADQSRLVPMREDASAIIINRRGFGGISDYDFWINIPYALYGKIETTHLRAVANNYKLASKRYGINYI